eukprot:3140682-Pyramimonas_sp.AAC.1
MYLYSNGVRPRPTLSLHNPHKTLQTSIIFISGPPSAPLALRNPSHIRIYRTHSNNNIPAPIHTYFAPQDISSPHHFPIIRKHETDTLSNNPNAYSLYTNAAQPTSRQTVHLVRTAVRATPGPRPAPRRPGAGAAARAAAAAAA